MRICPIYNKNICNSRELDEEEREKSSRNRPEQRERKRFNRKFCVGCILENGKTKRAHNGQHTKDELIQNESHNQSEEWKRKDGERIDRYNFHIPLKQQQQSGAEAKHKKSDDFQLCLPRKSYNSVQCRCECDEKNGN